MMTASNQQQQAQPLVTTAQAVHQPVAAAPQQFDMGFDAPEASAPLSFELHSGFHVTGRPMAGTHGRDLYEISGSDYSQLVEITVRPGERVTMEPGTMLYMTPGLAMETDVGGCGQGVKRCCCAGESMFRLHAKNETQTDQRIAITPMFPSKIQPVDLSLHSGMIFNRGAFLAAMGSTWNVNLKRAGSAGACCFGGQGLFMNTLHGEGIVFLNGGGTIMSKTLADGEELLVDHKNVLAFEKTVHLDVRRVGGLLTCCCAGQGLFNTVLRGPGFVVVNTMPLEKLRKAIGVTVVTDSSSKNGAGAS